MFLIYLQTILTFRIINEPGYINPDALGTVSGATRLRKKDIEDLEAEYAMLVAADLPTSDEYAGTWPRDAVAAKARHMKLTSATPAAASSSVFGRGPAGKASKS